jgi:small subunit ribosomal protein S11
MGDETESKAAAGNVSAPSGSTKEEVAEVLSATDTPAPVVRKTKDRSLRNVPAGIAHIKATFNNTTASISDLKGAVIAWSSAGRVGMSGSRKSTAFAAALVGQDAARQAIGRGMHELEVRIQGAGAGRESAIRALQSAGLKITVIKDVTPIPHNGCRPRKRRRV